MKASQKHGQSPYITKDLSLIRELIHPVHLPHHPNLGMSLAEATVEAGESTAIHFHLDFDEIYYGLEGEGSVLVENQKYHFTPGSYCLIPRNAKHNIKAVSKMRLLCICCPGYNHEQTIIEGIS